MFDTAWKGLDQGVEHTWTPEVLLTGLRIIYENQPVAHRDPDSAFYTAMEEVFPDKTWRAYDSNDNSFRPIFRRSNTWKKLGLIVENDKEFTVSFSGKQILDGTVKLNDVYANICISHIEEHEKPFVILANLLLKLELLEFSTDEILTYLLNWRPYLDINLKTLVPRRSELYAIAKSIDDFATRKRRISSMLKLFVSMGALKKNGAKFSIIDQDLLLQISTEDIERSSDVLTTPNTLQQDNSGVREQPITAATPRSKPFGTKRIITTERKITEFSGLAARISDPQQRFKLLEKATISHEKLISEAARVLREKYSYNCFENPIAYDLFASLNENHGLLIEVKTVHKANAYKQMREAVSQLYEYSFRYKTEISVNTILIILIDNKADELFEPWVFDYLQFDRNIQLWWMEDGDFKSYHLSTSPQEIIYNQINN